MSRTTDHLFLESDLQALLRDADHRQLVAALQLAGEAPAVALAKRLGWTDVTVWAHVHRLVGKGLVEYRVEGFTPIYFLTDRALQRIAPRNEESL